MDTCWSNFKQFFGDLYEYSYELSDTARYITLYDRLMRHWRETLPGRFIDVSYEALVENPQQESLRVFDYCGLEWQDACLEYHRSAEAVTTASSVQVRQPIYRNSLQRWKKLEHRMGEVKAIFDEAGIAY